MVAVIGTRVDIVALRTSATVTPTTTWSSLAPLLRVVPMVVTRTLDRRRWTAYARADTRNVCPTGHSV